MAVYQRDEFSEKYRTGPGCLLGWAWWVATVAGDIVGTVLIVQTPTNPSEGGLAGVMWAALIGLLSGTCLGAAQAVVLMPYLKLRGFAEWIAATVVGRVLRSVLVLLLIDVVFQSGTMFICLYLGILTGIGAVAGGVTGYFQQRVLDHRVAQPHWWVVANVGVSAVTAALIGWFGPEAILIHGILLGGVTGYLLMDLLRHPTSQAEWRLGWRRKLPGPPRSDRGTQPSPEALLDEIRQRTNRGNP